jgi:hypothetical protein
MQRVWPTWRSGASPHRAVLYPTEGVFRPNTLGRAILTLHSGMARAKVTVASYPPRYRARVFSVPNSGHAGAVPGSGMRSTGTASHGTAVTTATQGDEVRIVVSPPAAPARESASKPTQDVDAQGLLRGASGVM